MKINFDNKNVLKVLSLISAIILWSFVMSSENPSIEKEISNIPVEYLHEEILSNKGLIILDPVEPTVKIRVLGKRNAINRTDWSKVKARVNLSQVSMEDSKVPIELDLPDGISLVQISDDYLYLTIDHYLTKRFTVTVEPIGEFPEASFSVLESSLSPGQIQVSGAETIFDDLEKVVIFPDLSTITDDMVLNEPIKLLDKDGNEVTGLKMSKDVTDYTIKLNQEKDVPVSYQIVGELGEGYELKSEKLSPEKVRIKGAKKKIDGIEEIKSEPVDISSFIQNMEVPLTLALPEGINVLSNDKPILSIVIKKIEDGEEKEGEKSLKISDLEIENLKEDLTVAEMNQEVTVTVIGKEEELENLKPENIQLKVNLENLEEGTHKIPLEVLLPEDHLTLKSFEPKALEIILKKNES